MKILAAANVVVLMSVVYLLWKRECSPAKFFFLPGLGVKLLAGIMLGLLYQYYYHFAGDTFRYFDDAVTLARQAQADPSLYLQFLWQGDDTFPLLGQLYFQEPRALFMTKLASVVSLVSGHNYWITSLYFSFVSFCGAWFLVRTIVRYYPHLLHVSVFSFLFFPSVVFWTSGLIKESFSMASLYFLVAVWIKLWHGERVGWRQWVVALVALWVLWNLKYYYLAVFAPVAATGLVMRHVVLRYVRIRQGGIILPLWLIIFIIPLYVASQAHPNFYPERFFGVIVSNYEAFVALSEPTDVIHFNNMTPDVAGIVRQVPGAIFGGLFRPLLWDVNTPLQFFAACENAFLLLVFITSLPRWKNLFQSQDRVLLFSCVVYVFVLCVFLTLSTPNFGTLSRYRVGFLPFFILLILAGHPGIRVLKGIIQRSFG